MSPEFTIRPIAAADLSAVMELASGLPNVPRWSATAWQEAIKPPHIALAAADAATVRAFVIAVVGGGEAEIESLAVAPASRRRGLAWQLLSALVAELRHSSVAELWLEVRASNAAAISLYRGFGFAETGRRPEYYSNPAEDAILMRLLLD